MKFTICRLAFCSLCVHGGAGQKQNKSKNATNDAISRLNTLTVAAVTKGVMSTHTIGTTAGPSHLNTHR